MRLACIFNFHAWTFVGRQKHAEYKYGANVEKDMPFAVYTTVLRECVHCHKQTSYRIDGHWDEDSLTLKTTEPDSETQQLRRMAGLK